MTTLNEELVPAPADAVRVWRGFRRNELSLTKFYSRLGSALIPAGIELQKSLNLRVYVPAVSGGAENKPDTVPDETAILFWETRQTYHDAFKTVAERVFLLIHETIFRPPSTASFPKLLQKAFDAEQPYYLFDTPADWMYGVVKHLIGGRPDGQTPAEFLSQIQAWAEAEQQRAPEGLDGAIICAGNDYLVYWEHWADATFTKASSIKSLGKLVIPALLKDATPVSLPAGLWSKWEGLTIACGDCLNLQFERRQ